MGRLAHIAVGLGLVVPVIGGPLGPLVVRLAKGKESSVIDANAVEALNFGILLAAVQLIASALPGTLFGTGLGGLGGIRSLGVLTGLLPLAVTVATLVFAGMAALKANTGRVGTYPDIMPRFIRGGDDGTPPG